MKKLIYLILTILLVFTVCVLPAFATDNGADDLIENEVPGVDTITEAPAQIVSVPPDEATPGELPAEFTWKYLITTGGAAIFVYFVVQFAKAPLDKVGHIPTRLLVYILSLLTLLIANIFLNHGINLETAALCVFNALISAYGAYGMYEVWAKKKTA